MGHTRTLFNSFLSFQPSITFFITIICKKCPSNLWCWESNPLPSTRQPHPVTTRPGLPPNMFKVTTLKYFLLFTLCGSFEVARDWLVKVPKFNSCNFIQVNYNSHNGMTTEDKSFGIFYCNFVTYLDMITINYQL